MSLWGELRRRNVVRVGIAYLVAAWIVIQVADTLFPALRLPAWTVTFVAALLLLGFPVALVLSWAYELTPEGLKKSRDVAPSESIAPTTGRRIDRIIIVILALAVTFLVADSYLIDTETAAESSASAASPEARVDAGPSVAVLPFANLSSDPDQDYFSDGISLELRDLLYNAEDLYVTPRELVLPLKDSPDPPAEIARALGVTHLLTGSIRKAGRNVRITADLMLARDGSRVWTESYDGTLANVLDFQAAIAGNVVEELTGSFDADVRDVFPGGTDNEAAYDLYLQGQASDLFAARDLYREALSLDPDFALAQTALAGNLLFHASAVGAGTAEAPIDEAERALERAVELGPELIDTQLLVARRNIEIGQWLAAERVYLAALEQTGDRDFDVHMGYGSFLTRVGRLSDAIPYLQRARRLAPLSAGPNVLLAIVYDALGERARVEELSRSAEELFSPTPFTTYGPAFWRALYDGEYAEARRLEALGFGGNSPFPDIEDRDAMLAWATETFEDPEGQFALAQQFVAFAAVNFGDTDLALAAWRRTLQSSTAYMMFHWTPLMTPVRTHPDIQDALREAGFVDYWRQAEWPDQCFPLGEDEFECR